MEKKKKGILDRNIVRLRLGADHPRKPAEEGGMGKSPFPALEGGKV